MLDSIIRAGKLKDHTQLHHFREIYARRLNFQRSTKLTKFQLTDGPILRNFDRKISTVCRRSASTTLETRKGYGYRVRVSKKS